MYKQDLFWANIPVPRRKTKATNLGFLSSMNEPGKLFFNNNNPLYVWTGTNRIKKLEKIRFSEKIKNKLKKKTIEIYLYEPICLKINNEYNCSFYSEFNNNFDDSEIMSEELESIRIFKNNNDLKNIKVFTSDYNIEKLKLMYPEFELYCLDSFLRFIEYNKRNFNSIPHKILKKFWCGNWRYTAHRHLVMAYLVNKEGNYSWNISCDFQKLKENVWFDLEKFKKTDLQRYNEIKSGVEFLKNNILRIDTNHDAMTVNTYSSVYIPNGSSPPPTSDFFKSYKECFCAIINETRYAQPFGYFSEKTTSSMLAKLPFVLVAPPHTLEYLKTFGFKTFDRWWDESYDQEENHEKRLIKIFEVIDKINNYSLDELNSIYQEMSDILDQNQKIVNTIPYNSVAL